MTSQKQFKDFSDKFTKKLKKQTGLNLGEYTALILAGQNPAYPSEVMQFAKRLIKRRDKGQKVKTRDVDALLNMVVQHMEYQSLNGRDRVSFTRNLINKIIPSLSATDLQDAELKDIRNLQVTDEFRGELTEWLSTEI